MWKVGAQASIGDEASSGEVEIKGEYIHIPCKIWVYKLCTKFIYSPSEEVGGEDEASEETNEEA